MLYRIAGCKVDMLTFVWTIKIKRSETFMACDTYYFDKIIRDRFSWHIFADKQKV